MDGIGSFADTGSLPERVPDGMKEGMNTLYL